MRPREKGLRDYVSGLENAREEGLAEGREEGIEQKTQETVLNMKAKGFDIKIIAECLNISEDKVKELLN